MVSCTLPSAVTADSSKVYKTFVDEATQAASSACKAAEEAANVVINISKEMMDAEKAAQIANLMVRLQVSSSLCPENPSSCFFLPCTLICAFRWNDPNLRR